MKEFGLQRIWEKLAFQPHHLATDNGHPLQIINQGEWNHQNGPDFLNAEILLNGIRCFGAVEIHVNASDWYLHNHHKDPRYNGVILHVVWQNDRPCFTESKDPIPCISIKSRVSKINLTRFGQVTTLPCAEQLKGIPPELFIEQLEISAKQRSDGKTAKLLHAHNQLNQDWWLTALYAFMSAWIGKANQHHCIDLCKHIRKSLILKATTENEIVAYLLGLSGLMGEFQCDREPNNYQNSLVNMFQFQTKKYQFQPLDYIQWNNRQVRPASFPSIRMAQFGSWLFEIRGELSQFFKVPDSDMLENLSQNGFLSNLNGYWKTHYEWGKPSDSHNPNNGIEHARKVILNGLIPLWNTLAKETQKPEFSRAAEQLLRCIPSETNATVKKMLPVFGCKPKKSNASWSQSLIAQHQLYCKPLQCAKCLIGEAIIHVPFMRQES